MRLHLLLVCSAWLLATCTAGAMRLEDATVDTAGAAPATQSAPTLGTLPNADANSQPLVPPSLPPPGFTFLGRTTRPEPGDPNRVRLAWPATAIGVRFFGSELAIRLADTPGNLAVNLWRVDLDGNTQAMVLSSPEGGGAQPVVAGLAAAEHTVWVHKRMEWTIVGEADFTGVDVGAQGELLSPPPAPSRRIEVIGASQEAGFGIDGVDPCPFTPAQQDATRAWPQLLADQVGAELSATAASGSGLVFNINLDQQQTLPVWWPRADPADANEPMDFAAKPMDAVFIDLGVNDEKALNGAHQTLNNTSLGGRFVAQGVAFVAAIAAAYPGVFIYALVSPTADVGTQSSPPVSQVVGGCWQEICRQATAAGTPHVAFVAVDAYAGPPTACGGHAPPAVHQALADALAPRLQADLGW